MRNLRSSFSYNGSSENSYLKLFQTAHQNLNLFLKEERAAGSTRKNYLGRKEQPRTKK